MTSGALGSRRCIVCLLYSNVLTRTVLISKEFVTLECGHRLTYDIDPALRRPEGDSVYSSPGGTDYDCPLCGDHYTTFSRDDSGKICLDCRREQSAHSAKDVNELLGVLVNYTPEDLTKTRLQIKQARAASVTPSGGHVQQASVALAKAPPVDPEKVAGAVRSMTAYGVLAHDLDRVDKPTAYVIAKNGLFHVSHSDLVDIISIPKEVAGVNIALKEGVHLKVPKVPFALLSQTVAFFKAVEKKSGAEALVQIWWNTQEKRHEIHCPDQTVSGGSVNHRSTFDQEQARTPEGDAIWLHMMDIHSHNTMSAFWSGTDNGDEMKAPEGRMFGVIGKIKQSIPDWKWRIRTRDGFLDLQIDDLFAVDLQAKVPFTVTWDVIIGSLRDMVKDPKTATTDGSLMLRCPVDPFADATFPEEWMNMLSGRVHSTGPQQVGGAAYSTGRTPIASFIYIRSADGKQLDEFELNEGKPTPTGKSIQIIRGRGEGRLI